MLRHKAPKNLTEVRYDTCRTLKKHLRRAFRYSAVYRWAAKEGKGCYRSHHSQCKGPLELDHLIPVARTDGPTNIVEQFKRMFCLDDDGDIVDTSNLVWLCEKHHAEKSLDEKRERAKNKVGEYGPEAKAYRARGVKRKKTTRKKKKAKTKRKTRK